MADDFDRFTPSTRRALTSAQAEAQRLNHPLLDTEHLLLGLVLANEGIACTILQNLGVNGSAVRKRIEQLVEPGPEEFQGKISLTAQTRRVVELAVDEARRFGYSYLGTEHLLAGLLKVGSGLAYQVLIETEITLDKVRLQMELLPRERVTLPLVQRRPPEKFSGPTSLSWRVSHKLPLALSPVFGIIVIITVIAGFLTYQQHLNPNLTIFVFITGGWVISLSLHEFGHAIVAYWGGDEAVVDKGYLTLNPIKYTHSVLSIILPLIYLALGGIGLPGGAVYINPNAIRSRSLQSLTSAAGPLATVICAAMVLVPFAVVPDIDRFNHVEFWAGLAFLASLEVSALIFNLLPIPGLDGFGIIAPYLPRQTLAGIRGFGPYTLVFIFILFSNQTFSRGFWAVISFVTSLFNLDYYWVYEGFHLFRFWMN